MVYELKDDKISFFKQYFSVIIIIANIIVYILTIDSTNWQVSAEALDGYAFVPSEFLAGVDIWTIFTAMFMHADPVHIIMNMWFFYVVTDNCEHAMGHIMYAITYFVSGIAASLLHTAISTLIPGAVDIPSLGASGAIMGVVMVYGILFPKIKLGIISTYRVQKINAAAYVLVYFTSQIIYGVAGLLAGQTTGTAYFAHIGGAIAGAIIAVIFRLARPDYAKKKKS
jgi:membrane associated rhomboid family serine protease